MINTFAKLSIFIFLSGCSVGEFKPKEFKSPGDIKAGPGLLSGENGKFTLYQGDPLAKNASKEIKSDQ
jgi:hypothetical protein